MPRKKSKKPKSVNIALVSSDHIAYDILRDLIASIHHRLAEAKIALAWHLGWKADKDDRLKLGQARKASDLDRELREYDLVILLNRPAWEVLNNKSRIALVDHELTHCEISRDDDGEEKRDSRGRICYRMRKHDIEEFGEVVERNGLYKSDLVRFTKIAIAKADAGPLFADATVSASENDGCDGEAVDNDGAKANPPPSGGVEGREEAGGEPSKLVTAELEF